MYIFTLTIKYHKSNNYKYKFLYKIFARFYCLGLLRLSPSARQYSACGHTNNQGYRSWSLSASIMNDLVDMFVASSVDIDWVVFSLPLLTYRQTIFNKTFFEVRGLQIWIFLPKPQNRFFINLLYLCLYASIAYRLCKTGKQRFHHVYTNTIFKRCG